MLVSGFTIIRNGVKFDFPFLESIQSALPVCDEFVVNIGVSEDSTKKVLEDFRAALPQAEAAKLKFFDSQWPVDSAEKRKGGQILADQTNLALSQCQGTWCLYLQADEVLHEEDHAKLRSQLEQYSKNTKIEGVVLNYVHFYGTYNVIQTSRSAYRREVRIIRNRIGVQSIGDAQGFRHDDGRKLNAVVSRASVYHYGWVRPQEVMKAKTAFMDTLYHPEATVDLPATGNNYLYKRIVGLRPFTGSHPKFMQARVEGSPRFDFSKVPKVFHWKDTWKVLSGWIEQITGVRLFEYKNYRRIRL
ncbi:MAG: glycosyltransferase family 2 protein [Bdellovibrionota bacterium]